MPTLPRRPLLAGLLAAAALTAPAAAQSPPPVKIAVMGDMYGP